MTSFLILSRGQGRPSQLKELLNTLDQHFADTKLSSALFEQNESISQFFVFTSFTSMQDDSLFNANDFSLKTHSVNFINISKNWDVFSTANEAFQLWFNLSDVFWHLKVSRRTMSTLKLNLF